MKWRGNKDYDLYRSLTVTSCLCAGCLASTLLCMNVDFALFPEKHKCSMLAHEGWKKAKKRPVSRQTSCATNFCCPPRQSSSEQGWQSNLEVMTKPDRFQTAHNTLPKLSGCCQNSGLLLSTLIHQAVFSSKPIKAHNIFCKNIL